MLLGEVCSTRWKFSVMVRTRCRVRRRSAARLVSTTPRAEPGAFERGFMGARENPGFVGNARSVGTQGNVVSAGFEHAEGLALFLAEDVAEHAALFGDEVFASCAQFVKYAARNK